MMIQDSRACARALNQLLAPQEPDPAKKRCARQVQVVKAYFFGHYDSRGGAFMVLACNHIEALKKYVLMAWQTDLDAKDPDPGQRESLEKEGLSAEAVEAELASWTNGLVDSAQEDFLFQAEVVVCDEPLPAEDAELDCDYGDPKEGIGYKYGRVQSRYALTDWSSGKGVPTGKHSKWMDCSTVFLWRGRAPNPVLDQSVLSEQYRIKRLSLGEDACGLVLVR